MKIKRKKEFVGKDLWGFAFQREEESFLTYRWERICGERLGLHFGEKLGKDAL